MAARVSAERRRVQVIDVALAQYATRGFDATTIAGVAAELETDRVTVYRLFADGSALFAAVLDRVREAGLAAVDEAMANVGVDGTPRTRAEAVFGAFVRRARAEPSTWRFLRMRPSDPDAAAALAGLNAELAGRMLHGLVAHGRRNRPGLRADELAWGTAFVFNGALGAIEAHLEHMPASKDARFVAFLAEGIERLLAPPAPGGARS